MCTADPTVEPPMLVISTVLSVMAYDYPKEKLNIYLSDDAGSIITLYALYEASEFAKHWLPFCNKYQVEPRSPAAYFGTEASPPDACDRKEWFSLKVACTFSLFFSSEHTRELCIIILRIKNWNSFYKHTHPPTIGHSKLTHAYYK